jgi:hypothetical protein
MTIRIIANPQSVRQPAAKSTPQRNRRRHRAISRPPPMLQQSVWIFQQFRQVIRRFVQPFRRLVQSVPKTCPAVPETHPGVSTTRPAIPMTHPGVLRTRQGVPRTYTAVSATRASVPTAHTAVPTACTAATMTNTAANTIRAGAKTGCRCAKRRQKASPAIGSEHKISSVTIGALECVTFPRWLPAYFGQHLQPLPLEPPAPARNHSFLVKV